MTANFAGVSYPASGATTQYVCGLARNTAYTLTGAGVPATATTDSSGVLRFAAAGEQEVSL